jgi:uncharacterized Tic20 family protein
MQEEKASPPALPTGNERILAVLAHLAALVHGLGLPLPALLWAEQRKDSRYVAFQTLQAYAFQSLGYTLWALTILALAVFLLLGLVIVNALAPIGTEAASTLAFVFSIGVTVLFMIYNLLAIVAALACAFGRDFRFPILGGRLAKYIAYDPASPDTRLDETCEERFAVAMGHFAVIFPFYGLLGPLGLWLTQGKRSAFLRLHSAQTVAYQAVGSVLYTALHLIPLILILPFMIAVFSFGAGPAGDWANPVTAVMALVGLCLLAVGVTLGPLYHILGQWAGLQTLLGRDFRYPLFARLVARLMGVTYEDAAQK